jgi:hypothetical protein
MPIPLVTESTYFCKCYRASGEISWYFLRPTSGAITSLIRGIQGSNKTTNKKGKGLRRPRPLGC